MAFADPGATAEANADEILTDSAVVGVGSRPAAEYVRYLIVTNEMPVQSVAYAVGPSHPQSDRHEILL